MERFKLLIEYGTNKSGHWGHKGIPKHKGGSLPKSGQMGLEFPKRMRRTTGGSTADKLLVKIKDGILRCGELAWAKTINSREVELVYPDDPSVGEWEIGKEYAILLNTDGTIDKECGGSSRGVNIPVDWGITDKILVHTHPSSEYLRFNSPFSIEDIWTTMKHGGRGVAVSSEFGTIIFSRKSTDPKDWGMTVGSLQQEWGELHRSRIDYFRALRGQILADLTKTKGSPLTARESHFGTMTATHLTNYQNIMELAERHGWTFMYIPGKGHTKPEGVRDVNPWRVK